MYILVTKILFYKKKFMIDIIIYNKMLLYVLNF